MEKFFKVTLDEDRPFVCRTLYEATALDLETGKVGEKWTIEIIEMTQEEFEELPEHKGY